MTIALVLGDGLGVPLEFQRKPGNSIKFQTLLQLRSHISLYADFPSSACRPHRGLCYSYNLSEAELELQ